MGLFDWLPWKKKKEEDLSPEEKRARFDATHDQHYVLNTQNTTYFITRKTNGQWVLYKGRDEGPYTITAFDRKDAKDFLKLSQKNPPRTVAYKTPAKDHPYITSPTKSLIRLVGEQAAK